MRHISTPVFFRYGFLIVLVVTLVAGCRTPDVKPAGGAMAGGPVFEITGGSTAGPLRIDRMELRFENGFGSMTVPRNDRLGAEAIVRFSGNGPFRAEWHVDGRPVEFVNLIVTNGSTLRLPTAPGTVLPTFEPGPHEVTLKVIEPVLSFDSPEIRYMVTMERK